jgi:hypothetical protein
MAPNSPTARGVALRLLSTDRGLRESDSNAPDLATAVNEAFARLSGALTRWFGPFGYHALLSRSLAHARSDHLALDTVRIRSATHPSLEGLAEGIERHGADAVSEGIVATLVALIDLLSRLIGDEMALRLINQCVPGFEPEIDRTNPGGTS